jgi:hypothetical protein
LPFDIHFLKFTFGECLSCLELGPVPDSLGVNISDPSAEGKYNEIINKGVKISQG